MFAFHYHGSVVQWVLVGYQSDHKEIRLEKKKFSPLLVLQALVSYSFFSSIQRNFIGEVDSKFFAGLNRLKYL